MKTFFALLQIATPLYLLLLTGNLARRAGMLADTTRQQLSQLVFYIFAPALIIQIITAGDALSGIPWRMLSLHVVLLTLFAAVCMLALRKARPELRGVFTQSAYRANMVFFGLPVLALVYGGSGISSAVPMIIFVSMIYFNLSSVIVLSLPHHQLGSKMQPSKMLREIAANPLIIACLLGFGLTLSGLPQPRWFSYTLGQLAIVAAPLALIDLGAGLSFERLSSFFGWAGVCALLKLLGLPALYLFVMPRCGVGGDALNCLIILVSCPTAVLSYIMACQMKGDEKFAADSIVVSSALSLITIPFWLLILGLGR